MPGLAGTLMTPEAWMALAPALSLVAAGVVVLLAGSGSRRPESQLLLSLLGLGAAGFFLGRRAGVTGLVLSGALALDPLGRFAGMVVVVAAGLSLLFAPAYLRARGLVRPEYFALVLFATAGMVLLAGASDLVSIFLSLEVLSLCLYALAAFATGRASSLEAGLKYLVLGAFSSAIFLYGAALAYGATGATALHRLGEAAWGALDPRVLLAGLALLAGGLAFKVGAVPFQFWLPDVYQGAPTPVTAFMASGTKVAAFAALLRLLYVAFPSARWDWRLAAEVAAWASMFGGAFLALTQTDVKRMLAYSSVAHAGFLLVGVSGGTRLGVSGVLFYLSVYILAVVGAFGVLALAGLRPEERWDLRSLAGLGRRNPVLGGAFAVFLLSLAGIPPTSGFMAKFYVFGAALSAGQTPLVLGAVLASAVAAFAYIRVVVALFLEEGEAEVPGVPGLFAVALGLAAFFVLALGVMPGGLMDIAAASSLFAAGGM